jgi:D-arginine dehydrogenase
VRIIVIGGGIAGVSAAATLSEHGDVTLLEAEDALGYHASGRSAAMFEENYGNAAVRALNRASKPAHESAGVLSPRGILMVALAEEAMAFERDCVDMGMTEISMTEARARVPILSPKVVRAAIHEEAMDVDTDRLLQSFARKARANGARLVTGTRVSSISRDTQWVVQSGSEGFRADVLVNAGGAWADGIAAMAGVRKVGLQPFRRSIARLPAPGGHDVRDWPMLFGPGENWYAKPDAGGWIVSPAEEDPVEPMDAWADDMVLAEGLARYERHVTEPVTRVETNWAGLRTFAPDRSLVVGAEPGAPGFFWLAGQGGYGFQTAPAAADLLAALVTGGDPEVPGEVVTALSPARFR